MNSKKLFRLSATLFNSGDDRRQPIPTKGNSMKPNQLATLVLRLMGIYCLIQFIPAISISTSTAPIIFSQDSLSHSEVTAIVMAALFLAFQLVAGILLIVKSVPWGGKLTPKDAGEANIAAVSFEQVQVFAFAVVGALIFAGALPQLLNSIYSFLFYLNQVTAQNPSTSFATPHNWRALLTAIGTLLKAALGLGLFFGARGFANFWRSLRTFGTPKSPSGN
ncbi:MAG: hypothetical protein ABSH15_09835 [Verrucomicrobiota bacterium]